MKHTSLTEAEKARIFPLIKKIIDFLQSAEWEGMDTFSKSFFLFFAGSLVTDGFVKEARKKLKKKKTLNLLELRLLHLQMIEDIARIPQEEYREISKWNLWIPIEAHRTMAEIFISREMEVKPQAMREAFHSHFSLTPENLAEYIQKYEKESQYFFASATPADVHARKNFLSIMERERYWYNYALPFTEFFSTFELDNQYVRYCHNHDEALVPESVFKVWIIKKILEEGNSDH